ncbi:hypothetical protein CYMTET_9258 [Cymbomonas tetramitiformis]|uniref:Uncharacterized protein n=1 Tax=Cymbomonas tetramitiformis TaxID=36881 RepID=A0AAE0GRF3_9CHLO|nr:hypothetical protein CYMTET_9258 [Cymbomonas tetramitiformis]
MMLLPVFLMLILGGRVLFNAWYRRYAAKVKWLVETKAPILLTPPPGKGVKWLYRAPRQAFYATMIGITQTLSQEDYVEFTRLQMRIFLTVCHLGYVFLASYTIEFFDCVKDDASGKAGRTQWFLQADPSIECFVFDNPNYVWTYYFPWAVLATLAYPVGILALFMIILFKIRNDLQHSASQNSIGFLYIRFKPEWFWFEILLMLRNVVVVLTELLFADDNSTEDEDGNEELLGDQYISLWQSLMAMAVLLGSMLVQFHAQPFDNRQLDMLEGTSVAVQGFTLFGGLIFLSDTGDKSTLSDTFKTVLAFIIIVLLGMTYIFMFLIILQDIFPDFVADIGKFSQNLMRRKTAEEKALLKKEKEEEKAKANKDEPETSVLSILAARKFADKLMVSKVGNLVFTTKGRSVALREKKDTGAKLHKERMLQLKTMYDFSNVETESIWIKHRDPHVMEKVLRKNKMLELVRLMSNRTSEENSKAIHIVEEVLRWKEAKDDEEEQKTRKAKLMLSLSQGRLKASKSIAHSLSFAKEQSTTLYHKSISNPPWLSTINDVSNEHGADAVGSGNKNSASEDESGHDRSFHVQQPDSPIISHGSIVLNSPNSPYEAHVSLNADVD